jgi:hypothetical protein
VISADAVCAAGRKVVLKKKRPGKDKRIGADQTNARSRWRLKGNRPNGRYYAKIRRTSRCPGDRSRTVGRKPRAF